MKKGNVIFLLLLLFLACKNQKKDFKGKREFVFYNTAEMELEDSVITIELEHAGMSCSCPQWSTPENSNLYYSFLETENPILWDSLFMEITPENDTTINPFDLEAWGNKEAPRFIFEGQFYKEKHPWTGEDGTTWNSKVFMYKTVKVAKK